MRWLRTQVIDASCGRSVALLGSLDRLPASHFLRCQVGQGSSLKTVGYAVKETPPIHGI